MEPPKATTEETYKKVTSNNNLPIDVEELNGCSLLWVGSRTAKKIIVYACGGGLVMYAFDAHIQLLINGYKIMQAEGHDVSIVFLQYRLCPGAPYPTSIRDAVTATQHLLKTRAPETITWSGDSAGGFLVTALLLHHSHPHPSVPPYKLPPGSRFDQAYLISPGAPVMTDTASMRQDPVIDSLTPESGKWMWNQIISTSEPGIPMPNPWIYPASADKNWWKDLPVGTVTIIVGGEEVLRDDILAFSKNLKKYHTAVDLQVFKDEIHDQALVDMAMGVTEDKASTKHWKAWFKNFKT